VSEEKVYNPLAKRHLGESVEKALLESKVYPLSGIQRFEGAGIYVIYYSGDYLPYKSIASKNKGKQFIQPIYVGKAIPSGGRKGGVDLGESAGEVLFNRLNEHAESIDLAGNLELKDFSCRYLAVDDIWIPLGESLLINKFIPLWNVVVEGFGNHDPGSGRHKSKRPTWDTLHPGRKWAKRLKPSKKMEKEILADIKAFFQAEQ
jgi:hypothetical protein